MKNFTSKKDNMDALIKKSFIGFEYSKHCDEYSICALMGSHFPNGGYASLQKPYSTAFFELTDFRLSISLKFFKAMQGAVTRDYVHPATTASAGKQTAKAMPLILRNII
ncbi:MAG: hypothetical protein L6420_06760 [Elusimicrobia bacterium]|nr:hypothetical protein [Elusimicrobiota bacterium]